MNRTASSRALACAALLLSLPLASAQALRTVTVASGLDRPWGMAFLPGFEKEGRMLVTEKEGRLRIVGIDGRIGEPIQGVPEVDSGGQGGLLDVALDPQFADNRLVYLSYSEPGSGSEKGRNGTAVLRARLDGNRLADAQVIFRQQPKVASRHHFGSRLVFGRDGSLFVTLGDRFSRRDDAQRLDNQIGKLVRIARDGSLPPDNPLAGRDPIQASLWSWGHRNIQGAALHPRSGELWINEHGPQGGDEVNVAEAGRNYGWPVVTHGREYGTGLPIGEGIAKPGMEPPLVHWTPAIAPSGMTFLTSDRYRGWQGSVFLGGLRAKALVRLQFDGRKPVQQERLLESLGERIRDVRQGPDGWLYVLTDERDGKLIRLER